MFKYQIAALTTGFAGLAGALLVGAPAQATAATPVAPLAPCTSITVHKPTHNDTDVFSKATVNCLRTHTIYLQRKRAWGWSSENSKTFEKVGSTEISWRCDGVGTYTYRTLLHYRNGQGDPVNKPSEETRFSC